MHNCIKKFTAYITAYVMLFLYNINLSINSLLFNNPKLTLDLYSNSQFAQSNNTYTINTYTITIRETKKIKKQKNQNNN